MVLPWIGRRWSKLLAQASLFTILLCFFSFRHPWYPGCWLTLEIASNGPPVFDIAWNSGTDESGWQTVRTDYDSMWVVRVPASAPGGYSQLRFYLPQQRLRHLKITSPDQDAIPKLTRAWIWTNGAGGDQLFAFLPRRPAPARPTYTREDLDLRGNTHGNGYQFDNLRLPRSRMSLTLLLLQALAAAGVTYAVFWLIAEMAGRKLRDFLWTGDRKVLVLLFAFAAAVFSLWLVGQWPAGMMQDSLWGYDQSIGMWFDSWHPPLYYFYLIVLRQFWDSPAMIALFQVFATAVLGGAIFYYCFRRGVKLLYFLPFYCLFVFSIPVGLMNVWITKDVPNSLALVVLAFWMYHKMAVRSSTGRLEPVRRFAPVLLLITCAAELRYVGVIYYLVLPALLWYLVPWRDYAKILAFLACSFWFFHVKMPKYITTLDNIYDMSFLINPVIGIIRDPAHFSPNPTADAAFLQQFLPLDQAVARYDPTNAEPLRGADIVKYDQMSHQDMLEFRSFTMRLALDNLPQFLADRVEMTLSASGFSRRAVLYSNLLPNFDVWKHYYSPNLNNLGWHPLSSGIARIESSIMNAVMVPKGFWSLRTVVWDLSVPFGLIAVVLVWKGPRSPPGLFVCLSLVMLGTLFVLVPQATWRYFYSLYLSAFFVVPLCLLPSTPRTSIERGVATRRLANSEPTGSAAHHS
jgi:hypothetical protein